MDHASLDQIEKNVQKELDAKSAELGVTFNYADYTYNGQGLSLIHISGHRAAGEAGQRKGSPGGGGLHHERAGRRLLHCSGQCSGCPAVI